jgi:hypothetical protein
MLQVFGSIFGWLGMILLFLAYWLISYRKVNPVSLLYQGLFLLGSFCFAFSAYVSRNLPIALFNLFLVFITGYKIYKISRY